MMEHGLEDPELKAMQEIHRLLRELDEPAKERVLSWILARNQPATKGTKK